MNGVICSITNLQTRILTSLKKRVYTFLHGWVNANSIYYRFVIVEQLQKYINYKVEFPQGMIICILTTPFIPQLILQYCVIIARLNIPTTMLYHFTTNLIIPHFPEKLIVMN